MLTRVLATLALVPALSTTAAAAEATCNLGRYVVRGKPLVAAPRANVGAAAQKESVILLAGDRVSIDGVCPPVLAKVTDTRRGTRVKATWKTCDGIRGPVRLVGVARGEGCRSFNGELVRGRHKRRFRASFSLVGSTSCGHESTLEQMQRRIIGPRGCRVDTCHGVFKAGGLDLRRGLEHASLVNVPANNAAAAAAGKLRLVPGDPDASFLWQKLIGDLHADEGARMPQVGRTLDPLELELIRSWIVAGAPPTGRVATAPCLPAEDFHPAPALPVPDGGYQIVFEGPTLQPGEEIEGCTWVQVPNATDFVVGQFEYSLNPGTHHFAVWEHDHGPTPELNVFKRDVACFSGGARLDGVTLTGAGEAPYFVESYPAGVGVVVRGNSLIGINPHYHNEFDVAVQIKAYINMHPVQGELRHVSTNLVSTFAALDGKSPYSIEVPPQTTRTLRLRYGPTDETWSIYRLSGHQHMRGTRLSAWRSDGTKLFDNFDWSHPSLFYYDPPLTLAPGDYIEYECEHDNGVTRPLRRCGDSSHDKNCTLGEPVTVRFGLTSVDEMCLLVGHYYVE